jgi:hypothetical protein
MYLQPFSHGQKQRRQDRPRYTASMAGLSYAGVSYQSGFLFWHPEHRYFNTEPFPLGSVFHPSHAPDFLGTFGITVLPEAAAVNKNESQSSQPNGLAPQSGHVSNFRYPVSPVIEHWTRIVLSVIRPVADVCPRRVPSLDTSRTR